MGGVLLATLAAAILRLRLATPTKKRRQR
jgi:hypothetical protein